MWNAIDTMQEGEVSVTHFFHILRVVQPSLIMEEFRRKVVSRFRSIREAFRQIDSGNNVSLGPQELANMLEKLDISKKDTMRFFSMMDTDKSGEVSLDEFMDTIVEEKIALSGSFHRLTKS